MNFPTEGITLPMRWLRFGFQGTVNAKNFGKNSFPPYEWVLACTD